MYLTISAQKMGSTYNSIVGNYFDQENDSVSPQTVIDEIDANTAKLRQKDLKFYSIVVSPNQRELKALLGFCFTLIFPNATKTRQDPCAKS